MEGTCVSKITATLGQKLKKAEYPLKNGTPLTI